jgi:hypothetical protein
VPTLGLTARQEVGMTEAALALSTCAAAVVVGVAAAGHLSRGTDAGGAAAEAATD